MLPAFLDMHSFLRNIHFIGVALVRLEESLFVLVVQLIQLLCEVIRRVLQVSKFSFEVHGLVQGADLIAGTQDQGGAAGISG